jgi:hypothetical protein
LFDRLKAFIGGTAPQGSPSSDRAESRVRRSENREPFQRPSNGLEQFFSALRDRSGLRILDFAGASQANVSFITSLGHRLSSEDLMNSLEITFGQQDFFENQSDPQRVDQFLQDNLNFPPDQFDGALVWDTLQFLKPHVLQITIDRLYDTLRPGSYLLAFFHADEKAHEMPMYTYRIADQKNLVLTPRGQMKEVQFFNNRALEKLFHRYQSVKFFLTRDNLREIIVKR